MRIAAISTTLHGGVGKQVHLLSNELTRLGDQVTVFTCDAAVPAGALYDTVSVAVTPPGRYRWVFRAYVFAAALGKVNLGDYDVVHAHGWPGIGAIRHRRRLVTTFYGSSWDEARAQRRPSFRQAGWTALQLSNVPMEWLAQAASRIVVGISQSTKRRLPACQYIIPCGVDLDRYRPGLDSERAGVPVILSVGTTYWGRKRLWLLTSLFQTHVAPHVPGAQLWLVTNRRVTAPGVVTYTDVPEDTLVRLYQGAWAFCLPSTYEGFGVPFIEAMACGTMVIASPSTGALEVLGGGRYGRVVADADLPAALLGALSDPGAGATWREVGLARAQDFAMPAIARRYRQVYEAACG